MYYIKYISLVTVLALSFIFASNAYSQDDNMANAGSFYSGFGFGSPADVNSSYSMGMGLTGVSNYSGFSSSISNPAHWGLIGTTQGSISAGFINYAASDQAGSAQNALFAIENFQIVVPVLRNRLGVSASFTPVVRSDFKTIDVGTFPSVPDLDFSDIEYESTTVGTGGVNRFELGASYRITSYLSVGYGFSANLLSLNQDLTPIFSDNLFRPSVVNRSTTGYGMGHRFGVYSYLNSLFRNDDTIAFGASITLPVSIDAERSVSSFRTVNNQRVLVELNENSPDRDGKIELPLEFNTGLTYNLSRFTNISAELLFQSWGDATFSYNNAQEAFYKDRMKTGVGFQYHPYRTEQPGGFFSNFKYSLGTSYDNGHLSIDGQEISTLQFNAGIGLISQRSASTIDLSFHYGIRGTESHNLVKENIWGFKLSLNLAEFMFIRQRFQ